MEVKHHYTETGEPTYTELIELYKDQIMEQLQKKFDDQIKSALDQQGKSTELCFKGINRFMATPDTTQAEKNKKIIDNAKVTVYWMDKNHNLFDKDGNPISADELKPVPITTRWYKPPELTKTINKMSDKTKKELEAEIRELKSEKHGFVEQLRKDMAEIEKLKANQKPKVEKFKITLTGDVEDFKLDEVKIEGVSQHQAICFLELATSYQRNKANTI